MAAAILAIAGVLPLSAQNQAVFTNCNSESDHTGWGTSRQETYDVAIHLDSRTFQGLSLREFSFFLQNCSNISGCKAWLSQDLQLVDKVNIPDIASYDITSDGQSLSVALPDAYVVGPEGVYLGMSFNVDKRESDADKRPIAVVGFPDENDFGMYIHTSLTYAKWADVSEKSQCVPIVRLLFDNIQTDAARMTVPEAIYSVAGGEIEVAAAIKNYGLNPVRDIEIVYTIGNDKFNLTQTFDVPVKADFLQSVPINILLPAYGSKGEFEFEAYISKANGVVDLSGDKNITDGILYNLSHLPSHRPLVEEYTGFRCGFCPRGEVGLSKMRDMYPDRFICAAYHSDDKLSVLANEDFPNQSPGLPESWIDRTRSTDPYFGDMSLTSKEFGFLQVWNEIAAQFTPLDITLKCSWADDEKTILNVYTDYSFVKPVKDADYRLTYLLVADGLSDPQWIQRNEYSGKTQGYPSDFDFLIEKPEYIVGEEFNNVIIYTTGTEGIANSVPDCLDADAPYSHTMQIALADARSVDGLSLVQDKNKLRLIVLMINKADGSVINAAQAIPGGSGIPTSVYDGKEIIAIDWYTLQGLPTDEKYRGVKLKHITYSDGSVRTLKCMSR